MPLQTVFPAYASPLFTGQGLSVQAAKRYLCLSQRLLVGLYRMFQGMSRTGCFKRFRSKKLFLCTAESSLRNVVASVQTRKLVTPSVPVERLD